MHTHIQKYINRHTHTQIYKYTDTPTHTHTHTHTACPSELLKPKALNCKLQTKNLKILKNIAATQERSAIYSLTGLYIPVDLHTEMLNTFGLTLKQAQRVRHAVDVQQAQ